MIYLCYILIGISIVIFIGNIWIYQQNAEFKWRDEMGLGMTFSAGYALSVIPLAVSLFLHPQISWWWGLIALSTIFYGHLILRPPVHLLLKCFGLVDKEKSPD